MSTLPVTHAVVVSTRPPITLTNALTALKAMSALDAPAQSSQQELPVIEATSALSVTTAQPGPTSPLLAQSVTMPSTLVSRLRKAASSARGTLTRTSRVSKAARSAVQPRMQMVVESLVFAMARDATSSRVSAPASAPRALSPRTISLTLTRVLIAKLT